MEEDLVVTQIRESLGRMEELIRDQARQTAAVSEEVHEIKLSMVGLRDTLDHTVKREEYGSFKATIEAQVSELARDNATLKTETNKRLDKLVNRLWGLGIALVMVTLGLALKWLESGP